MLTRAVTTVKFPKRNDVSTAAAAAFRKGMSKLGLGLGSESELRVRVLIVSLILGVLWPG